MESQVVPADDRRECLGKSELRCPALTSPGLGQRRDPVQVWAADNDV